MRKRGRKNQSSRFQLFPVLHAHVYGDQARLLRRRGPGWRHDLDRWLKELFPKLGLQLERDVIFLPIGSTSTRYSALRMGTIDASPLSPPSSFMAQDAGYPALLRFSDEIEDIQASIVTTDDRLAR